MKAKTTSYEDLVADLFSRHPSVQTAGFAPGAYKPGLERMLEFDSSIGSPSRSLKCIHVAGTNGKGSVSAMIAAGLGAAGFKTALYQSPHLVDFRERMRIFDGRKVVFPAKDFVSDFLSSYRSLIDSLELSFFEIGTGMAFKWFCDNKVDYAVLETGLGGRLDATNIVTPAISVITSIGLDHCELLGDTREKIAAEKAGIIKPHVPVVVGTRDPETEGVFRFFSAKAGAPLYFADSYPGATGTAARLAAVADLQGDYQQENLATAVTALSIVLGKLGDKVAKALPAAGRRLDFRGRWDTVRRRPDIICDIGHNPPALERNFAQLRRLASSGKYSDLTIVFGMMADKDISGPALYMPEGARVILTRASSPRALDAAALRQRLEDAGRDSSGMEVSADVAEALGMALEKSGPRSLIYVGGSAYVVSDAFKVLEVSTGPVD
ncbi:MAG: bifunctional folylpolyglutamate synthase/dihydrofolate synthase [Bacteroidales bacterium]|nr:bifunctional folylpolyglutamate synthase/dihydrofolate synthase [Bacteroidales bacterium]